MNIILLPICCGVASFIGAWLAIRKKKFVIRIDKERDEIILEPQSKPGKIEFLEDPTEQDLKDLEKPRLTKFLEQFRK